MELNNSFRVSVEPATAWTVLSDVERIAPLLPGAQLLEVEGDDYRGIVKVKVGPIAAQYRGTATFVEKDQAAGRMVLKATGRDTRGQGNANALVTVTLSPDGGSTNVSVLTDLTITGKVAQFGRGVLADVSGKLISQFVDALEADITGRDTTGGDGAGSGDSAAGAASETAEAAAEQAAEPLIGGDQPSPAVDAPQPSGPRRIDSAEPEPVDLLNTAGAPVAKRIAPLLGAAGTVVVGLWVLRRRRAARRG